MVFLNTSNEQSEKKIKKNNSVYSSIQKNKILTNKFTWEAQDLYTEQNMPERN